jgi:cell shape-determining protein MreD
LIILPLLSITGFFLGAVWGFISMGIWGVYLLSLVLALPPVLMNRALLNALLRLPRAIFVMFGTLFQMKKANKTFIHTVHTKTEISNSLFNDKSKK